MGFDGFVGVGAAVVGACVGVDAGGVGVGSVVDPSVAVSFGSTELPPQPASTPRHRNTTPSTTDSTGREDFRAITDVKVPGGEALT